MALLIVGVLRFDGDLEAFLRFSGLLPDTEDAINGIGVGDVVCTAIANSQGVGHISTQALVSSSSGCCNELDQDRVIRMVNDNIKVVSAGYRDR